MHTWGDGFDFEGLHTAGLFIMDYTKRRSLCNLSWKEKYGTIRYEYIFPPFGSFYGRNRVHYWWICSRIYNKWAELTWYIVYRGIKKAIAKWPHLKDELLSDFAGDHPDIVGIEIYRQYWRS